MENQKRIILGLDISMHCTGIAKMSYDMSDGSLKLIDVAKFQFKVPRKLKGDRMHFTKALQFKQRFVDTYDLSDVTDIIIEEPLAGSNNVNTVNELLKFNGQLSWMLYEKTSIIPTYMSSYDTRRFAFPDLYAIRKFNKQNEVYPVSKIRLALKHGEVVSFGDFSWDCEKKMVLWNKINDMFPDMTWEYDSKGELRKENFDVSDAMVCIIGYVNRERFGDSAPEVAKVKEKVVTSPKGKKSVVFSYEVKFCGRTEKKKITVPFVEKS